MNLAKFHRRRYTERITPLEKLDNLSRALGGPEIYIKRDDLLGLTAGGNKTRKLEFLMADALVHSADTILTCGAVQSNHCRLTLSAAIKEGLRCQLILEERVPGSYKPQASGNNFLYKLLGAEKIHVVKGGSDMPGELKRLAGQLKQEGRKPYVIPGGGSNEIGALGYVSCAQELMQQLFQQSISIDHLIVPSGSAGTHAGIAVGLVGTNANIPVTGISVSRKEDAQQELVWSLAKRTAQKLSVSGEIPQSAIVVKDAYVGSGYSLPTDEMVEAVELLAKTEGILLDPVYTGKTMAGMIGMIRNGELTKGQNVLFLHTGGSPALYAYTDVIAQ